MQHVVIGMVETPGSQRDDVKLADIITQVNPDYKQSGLIKVRQWLFAFCSCFHPHERDLERLCQDEGALLPPLREKGRKTLVLDLDETLVHSVFEAAGKHDVVLQIDINSRPLTIYVNIRPGVQEFLTRMAESYEVVVYTASLGKYANPLLDKMDPTGRVTSRLFRESCVFTGNGYVKDLRRLGRDLKGVIIVDVSSMQNSPASYALQPENAVPITSWYEDPLDQELYRLIPVLDRLSKVEDVRQHIKSALTPSPTDSNSSHPELSLDRSFQLPKHPPRRRRSLNLNRGDFNSPMHAGSKRFDWDLNAKL